MGRSGTIRPLTWRYRSGDRAPAADGERVLQFPASFILIRHPEAGYILYDVGDFPDGEDGIPRPDYWKEYFQPRMEREDYVDRILPRHGIELSDISCIILSHMHYDHAGGIKFFKGTKAAQNVYVPPRGFCVCLPLRTDQ